MKETYEKPKMVTETIDIGLLVANGSPVPIAALEPFFGLCPPCP
jgi:hypothetical protein